MAFKDLLDRFKKGLSRTARLFDVRAWLGKKVDQDFLDKLEATLIQADVGVVATRKVVDRVRSAYAERTADQELIELVKGELKSLLDDPRPGNLIVSSSRPTVYLIAGINGSGKTTSIAKLAQRLKNEGKTILLAACDTFRAAAADQLTIWAERSGSDIVKGAPGGRPGQRGA